MTLPILVFDRDARSNEQPARLAFGVPAGTALAPGAGTVLYAPQHTWYERIGAAPLDIDVYRTRRREPPPEAIVTCPLPAEPRPVAPDEVVAWRALIAHLPAADRDVYARDEALLVRHTRGDLDLIAYISVCSWRLSLEQALAAGAMRMRSRELAWGSRPAVAPGRWEATIGLYGQIEVVAETDSTEAAEALALAAHGHAWWTRYREILAARRGRLDWGEPVLAATRSAAWDEVLAGHRL